MVRFMKVLKSISGLTIFWSASFHSSTVRHRGKNFQAFVTTEGCLINKRFKRAGVKITPDEKKNFIVMFMSRIFFLFFKRVQTNQSRHHKSNKKGLKKCVKRERIRIRGNRLWLLITKPADERQSRRWKTIKFVDISDIKKSI